MRKNMWVVLLAVFMMLSAVLAGCSSGKNNDVAPNQSQDAASTNGKNSTPSQPEPSQQEPEKPVEVTIMLQAAEPPPADYFLVGELEKRLNIKINLQTFLPDDYKSKINVGLASGSAPDMFFVPDRNTFTKLAKQGVLYDFTPQMGQLQPTVQFVGKDNLVKGQVGGKQLGIPQTARAYQYSLWARKDWLDALKLEPPKTIEDFMTVAKAMRFNDPDGNNNKDTYGYSGRPTEALGPLFGAFGTTYPGYFYLKDGKLVNSLYDPAMKDALAYIKELFDADVVDPELLANTKLQHKDKAFQGQIGMMYFNWPNIATESKVKEYKAINPKAEWIQIDLPAGPGGKSAFYNDMGAAAIAAFPKTVEKDPKKLEKLIELLNYVSSPEGAKLVMYGLEGVHYEMKDGAIVPSTDEATVKDASYTYLFQFTGRDEMVYLKTKFAAVEAEYTFANNMPRLDVYNSYVESPEGFVAADATRYIEEELYKFIYGKRPLSEYDKFIDTLETTFKYKQYMESAESQLKEQGLIQ